MSLVVLTLQSDSGCSCMPGTLKGTLKNQTSVSFEVGILRVYLEYFGSKILQLHVPFFSKKLDLILLKVQQIQIDENMLYTSFFAVLVGRVVGKTPEYVDETQNYLNGNTYYDVEVLRVLKQEVSFWLFTSLNPSTY